MSLTRVSPALFQVSNNITSVTVGGSANTVSLTFDSNGVITGASNNALSVANTQITGLIQAAQIGSANATLVTSGTLPAARLPAGSVLQVVNATYATQVTNSTTTYADTGLTASITPRSASSKILVIANNAVAKSAGNTQSGVGLNIVRDATQIIEFSILTMYTNSSLNSTGAAGVCYLDSPATTSATTYKMQFKNSGANALGAFAQESNSTASIVLMEIQG